MLKKPGIEMSAPALALLCALFMVLFDNRFFWGSFFKYVDIASWSGFSFSAGVFIILTAIFSAICLTFSARPVFKPALIALLTISAGVSYFQTEYGVIIDKSMIQNVVETDYREATELISFSLLLHLALFALLPALAIGAARIRYGTFIGESLKRILAILVALVLAAFFIWANYKDFVIIGRAHRELRMFINPTAPLFESYKFVRNKLTVSGTGKLQQIGLDARRSDAYVQATNRDNRKNVVILVVGETARAKSFSLNGYARQTNPELAQDGVISFSNAYSCGTSTAESVPCIFSHFGREDYSSRTASRYENVLDVLSHAGIHVLWRDNNSGCKGVCDRVTMEDESALLVKEFCNDKECYDEVMLHRLKERIEQSGGDALIVLHQKGSHGPAYYRRHPQEFSRFTPECKDNAPQNCSQESLVNAYDNTILYTDHFLHRTIELLKSSEDKINSVMLYASDHGESLGENGIYLHGLPYMLAPDEQRHIPMIAWVSEGYSKTHQLDRECLQKRRDEPLSHDNITHSLLGLLGVQTEVYQEDHDLFRPCMQNK